MSHYQTLGIEPSADATTIRAAYLRAAKANHPDKGGDPEIMKSISLAYATLSNPDKRARYDAGEAEPSPGFDPFQASILSHINGAFQAVVMENSLEKIIYLDLFVEVQKTLKMGREQLLTALETSNKDLRKLKQIRRRVTYSGKDTDYITGLLNQQIKGLINQLKQLATEHKAMKIAGELMKGYSYKKEEKPTVKTNYGEWMILDQVMKEMPRGAFYNQT